MCSTLCHLFVFRPDKTSKALIILVGVGVKNRIALRLEEPSFEHIVIL